MTSILITREVWTLTGTQAECHANMKAETGVTPPNHQKLREMKRADSSSQPSEGTNPAGTLISDF